MTAHTQLDPQLREWATPVQAKYLDAIKEHGSMRAAARALKLNYTTIHGAVQGVRKKAVAHGYSPDHDLTHIVPEPLILRGVSTYYNAEGKPSGQWVKSQVDQDKLDAIRLEAFNALSETLPRLPAMSYKGQPAEHLVTVYTLTDCHIGMLAWGHETHGADWDLKIAEHVLVGCFAQMIAAAPQAAVGFVNQLGDFLHQDGLSAVTPTSGHNLDSDGRFPKLVEVAVRVLRRVIEMSLTKHERVVVLLAEGNHDTVSSVWLKAMFKALYENEPRLEVIDIALPYYAYGHGETMLSFHHGHLKKNAGLPLLMAAQFPRVWGATTKRYCHVGHRHHIDEKEHDGITVIQHPTLASRDAYAARGGWIAERQVTAITYHSKYGRVHTDTVVPEMLDTQ